MLCLEISVWRRDVEEDMWTAVEGFQRVSQYYIIAGLLTNFKWTVYKRAGALTTYRRKIPGMLNEQNPRIMSNNTKI
jgi:hypothetical protein